MADGEGCRRRRPVRRAFPALAAAMAATPAAWAGTVDTFTGGNVGGNAAGTALDAGANWSTYNVPVSTSDALIGVTAPTAAATLTYNTTTGAGGLSAGYGSLNDLNPNAVTIRNQVVGMTGPLTLTLGGGADAVAGSAAADLLYVGPAAAMTIDSSSLSTAYGPITVSVATGGGNVDVAGSLVSQAPITGTNVTLTKTGAGTMAQSGTIGGSVAVAVSAGTLAVTGTQSFTGGLTVNAGATYAFTAAAGVPASGPVTLNGGQLQYQNAGTGVIALSNRSLSLGTAAGVNSTLAATNTGPSGRAVVEFGSAAAVIGGAGGVVIAGSPTGASPAATAAIEFGGPNAYAGPTLVGSGQSLDLDLAGSSAASSLTLSGGALGIVTTNSLGATVARTAAATFAGVTLGPGGSTLGAVVSATNASAGTLAANVSLAGLSRSAGATLDVSYNASGTGALTTTTANGAGTILGGYATFGGGATFATVGAAGTLGGLPTAAYANAYPTATATTDFDAVASGTLAAGTVHALRISTAGVTVAAAGGLTVGSGGILVTPTAGGTASTLSAATLTAGAGNELVVHQYDAAAPLLIAAALVDGTAPTAVTKAGPGTLVLSADGTYTGGTTVNAGWVRANAPLATGSGPVTVNNGGFLGGNGSVGAVAVNAGGTIGAGGGTGAVGTLSTGPQAWAGGGTFLVKVDATGTAADALVMSGLSLAATPAAPFAVALTPAGTGATLSSGATYVLAADRDPSRTSDPFSPANAADTIGRLTLLAAAGTAGTTAVSVPDGFGLSTRPDAAGGYDLVLTTVAAPEPSSLWLLGLGTAAGTLGRRRHRTRRADEPGSGAKVF